MKPSKNTKLFARGIAVFAALSLTAAACGSDSDDASSSATDDTSVAAAPADSAMTDTTMASTDSSMTDSSMTDSSMAGGDAMASSEICDADGLVAAVQGGDEAGTLEGMADDPVGTAASSNPVLTTLVQAVTAAGLVDTLNSAAGLTVFAPTDCAFAEMDPATLEAALADPSGLLTTVLGYHVIPERLSSEDLAGMTELTTFTGATLPIAVSGDTFMVGGQATVLVPDIETANATVYLIDTVMVPPAG